MPFNYPLRILLEALGASLLARWGYQLVHKLNFFFVRPTDAGLRRYLQPPRNENETSNTPNEPWALITGSGAGLGRALAFELASKGFNIILHGSNPSKLQSVQESLQKAHPGRSIRTLILDARSCVLLNSANLAAKLDGVAESLKDIQLRILINNVGMPQADPKFRVPFDAIDTFTYDELLLNAAGNAVFPLLLTRALYPLLIRSQPALIVNVGSFVIGAPLFPSYGPAKAFTMASVAELKLENQMQERDIEVVGIRVVGLTGTDTINAAPTVLIPDAATYAKAFIRGIGCGHTHVAPYLPHALMLGVLDALPTWGRERAVTAIISTSAQEAKDKLKKL